MVEEIVHKADSGKESGPGVPLRQDAQILHLEQIPWCRTLHEDGPSAGAPRENPSLAGQRSNTRADLAIRRIPRLDCQFFVRIDCDYRGSPRAGAWEGVMTGGHVASLDHLRMETIDLCAIDYVTWGLLRRFRPADAMHFRVLAQTARSPSPPLVTSATTDASAVAILRESLDTLLWDPATAAVRETLGLTAVSVLNTSAYERLADYEKEAEDLGYPNLE
jgi:hypothetical protein